MTTLSLSSWVASLWFRALATGAAYAGLAVLGGGIVVGVARLVARAAEGRWRWLGWDGWGFLGRMAGVLVPCGWLLGALYLGLLSPVDAGLPVRLSYWSSGRWVTICGASLCSLVLIWGLGWLIRRPRRSTLDASGWDPRWEWPTHILSHEVTLAISRASLAPAFGVVWAPWLAAAVKTLLARRTAGGRRAWADPQRRPWLLLDLALDWIASGAFVATGSMGWALVLRAVGLGLSLGAYGLLARRLTLPSPVAAARCGESTVTGR